MKQGRDKVREMFNKNQHITDPRVIDMLVIKVIWSFVSEDTEVVYSSCGVCMNVMGFIFGLMPVMFVFFY